MTDDFKRYTFHIRPGQLEAMRKIETRDGVLVAEQIRRAIDMWIKAKNPSKPRSKK
jgi:hypothetical protein